MKSEIKKCLENTGWELGNNVLYQLCKKHPNHKTKEEIVAKIWLIGRSYAAALERRKTKSADSKINDDFYLSKAAPVIKASKIDKQLNKCRTNPTPDNLLVTHKYLTDVFNKISGLNKRSLASKYLHFHLPKHFFIYDSRAANGLNAILAETNLKMSKAVTKNYDEQYARFYNKAVSLKIYINQKYGLNMTCRQFDTLLINKANARMR